ncbi:hypothetical protein KM043_009746 [Ampulex compressa]|nr:hypothetical protein KM043_009746 [Ampulex compressa]
MKYYYLLLLTLSLVIRNGDSITLNGVWTGEIKLCDGDSSQTCTKEITFPGYVPGGIYTDLNRAGILPDNLIGMNDLKHRWVGNQSVVYTTMFDMHNTISNTQRTFLIFHGVDTFATISLNDKIIGHTSNMFIRYTFDVSKHLKPEKNVLRVVLSSAVKTAENLYNKQKKEYIVPPVCVPKEYNGECHVNHIRKMQASFSWDWGPAFPSLGIWKSVELVSANEALFNDITTDILRNDNTWNINITIFFDIITTQPDKTIFCQVLSKLYVTPTIINLYNITLNNANKRANATISFNVPTSLVEEWWPNGYGKQKLYDLDITIVTLNDIVKRTVQIGFRTVELVQEPLQKGLSFYFRINGIPIFAKGSNFIPASVFPELTADENTIRHLLLSAKETHMNMLRVWGGGVYESKLFYDLADKYGIMIWQDFMFACAMYPTASQFLNNVKEEVVQNVLRLKNHPSIVLWAGNNENEAALYGNWYGTGVEQVYKTDYLKLYVDLIKKEVEKLDHTRPFVVSSPGNGLYEEEYNFVGQNPYSNLYGDVHYYNYIKNGWDINQYPRARFSSEYGFQALPSIETIVSAIKTTADLSMMSNFMRHRQHLPFGNQFLNVLISKNFVIPHTNNTVRDFMNFIYLSQINQAVSIKIQTEFYRQAMSELNSIGEGMTMGALYWQLNDVWQAPSWSSIDFGGRWKMLHYYALDFFAPIIITSHLSAANELSVYIVSEKLYVIPNGTVEINVYKWTKMSTIYTHVFENITIEPNKAKKIGMFWLDKFLSEAGCGSLILAKKNCMLTLTLKNHDGQQIAPMNYVYPTVIKDIIMPVANVSIRVNKRLLPGKYSNYPDYEIEVMTNHIALFVWLEITKLRGRFSENGFHMFHNQKRIIFHAYEAVTPRELHENIRLTTLCDVYDLNRPFHINDLLKDLHHPHQSLVDDVYV